MRINRLIAVVFIVITAAFAEAQSRGGSAGLEPGHRAIRVGSLGVGARRKRRHSDIASRAAAGRSERVRLRLDVRSRSGVSVTSA